MKTTTTLQKAVNKAATNADGPTQSRKTAGISENAALLALPSGQIRTAVPSKPEEPRTFGRQLSTNTCEASGQTRMLQVAPDSKSKPNVSGSP